MVERDLSVIVLAGGEGRRMGRPKATLEFRGEPLLRRILHRLEPIGDDHIVVTRTGEPPLALAPPVRTAADLIAGAGPLSATVAGLQAAKHPTAVVVSCDLPFVSAEALIHLASLLGKDTDAVVPRVGGRPQPLAAIYRTAPAERAGQGALSANKRSMDALLERLRVRWVDPAELGYVPGALDSFADVDTLDDLRSAEQRRE